MISPDTTYQRCAYRLHDNGIHELIYYETSRYAVDEMIAHVDRILEQLPAETKLIRVLTDSSQTASQPFQYMLARLRELAVKYPNHPYIRSASLFDGGVMMGPADVLFRLITRRNKFRLFKPSQREEAIKWLLEE